MVSHRLNQLGAYAMAAVRQKTADLEARGFSPVDLGMGDPSRPTPELIRRACAEAVEKHAASGYPPFAGGAPFKETVARWFENRFGVSLCPETMLISSVGSKESIFIFPRPLSIRVMS